MNPEIETLVGDQKLYSRIHTEKTGKLLHEIENRSSIPRVEVLFSPRAAHGLIGAPERADDASFTRFRADRVCDA